VRSVRTPEFSGVVFHEVVAKSVLNRIPGTSPMPFDWTVNPYRGCSHACTYCMAGDTPILMSDGGTRPLAELRIGDRIYGTAVHGRERALTVTKVLDHWSVTKPAYRVTLEDGTRLVTSGDHRLLTDMGWKFVTVGSGRRARPHLRVGMRLVGTGGFAAPPKGTTDYRLGYLCGVVRCGGHLGHFDHQAGGRHRLCIARVEYEALARAREYLLDAGVATDRFLLRAGLRERRELLAVRTSNGDDIEEVWRLVRWPTNPSDDWRRGFLAGIFDACGEHDGEITLECGDAEIVAYAVGALRQLGFDTAIDTAVEGICRVRFGGGLPERLRFVHAIDPAITRKRTVDGAVLSAGAALAIRCIEPLGIELPLFDITTGTGDFIANGVVSHNCFARNSHTYLDLDAGADFDSQIVVKVNTPDVLARELRSPRWRREPVALGTNTDPYQRAEGRYQMMPGVIEAFVDTGTPFSILTKGTLLARDLPILVDASTRVRVGLAVSIALADRQLSASVEPGTPSPQARLELVRRITEAGLRCAVMVAPVLPCLTDGVEALDTILGEIKAAGATGATVLALHLRPGAREWYRAWLAREHPDLVSRYDEIYARGSYANRRYRAWLARRVGPLVRKHGLQHRPSARMSQGKGVSESPTVARVPLPAAEQLSLM
jgi:DNA repair photolyase